MIIDLLAGTVALTLATLIPPARRFLGRVKRAASVIARDRRIPRWLSWPLVALAVAPIPGEFDELAAAVLLVAMWPRYGRHIREAWSASAVPTGETVATA